MQLSRYIDLASVARSTASAVCEVDTQGCEGVLFISVPATTVAQTGSLSLTAGNCTGAMVACASTFTNASTAAGGFVLVTDVYKPAKRWIGATCVSTSTGALPYWTMGFKYGLRAPLTGGFSSTEAAMPVASAGVLRVISPTSST
jgi:hypothetical protein